MISHDVGPRGACNRVICKITHLFPKISLKFYLLLCLLYPYISSTYSKMTKFNLPLTMSPSIYSQNILLTNLETNIRILDDKVSDFTTNFNRVICKITMNLNKIHYLSSL